MKRLIVNADDLAADEARNAGIFEAIEHGRVTSVSLLPNGPALEDALHRIRSLGRRRVSVGVHLNLSEGRPVSPDLRLLTGPDTFFLGKTSAQNLLMRPGDQAIQKEISREMSAQIRVLLDSGIQIDHLDGHQHVHLFPAVIGSAVRIAEEYKVPWMRMPRNRLLSTPTVRSQGRRWKRPGASAKSQGPPGSTSKEQVFLSPTTFVAFT